jgi:cbb3-type cytochrome oxidase maturation protein
MTALAWLVPLALSLGALGLAAFLWSLQAGQFEDLEGAAWRALDDDTVSANYARNQGPGPRGPSPGEGIDR